MSNNCDKMWPAQDYCVTNISRKHICTMNPGHEAKGESCRCDCDDTNNKNNSPIKITSTFTF